MFLSRISSWEWKRGTGRITDLFDEEYGLKLEALKIVYDNRFIELDLQKTFKYVKVK